MNVLKWAKQGLQHDLEVHHQLCPTAKRLSEQYYLNIAWETAVYHMYDWYDYHRYLSLQLDYLSLQQINTFLYKTFRRALLEQLVM